MTTSTFPRLCAGLYLVLVSYQARAQPSAIDCDAVKKAAIPVELSYHLDNGSQDLFQSYRALLQSYRDLSGDGVVWERVEAGRIVLVTKFTFAEGFQSERQAWTTVPGKSGSRTIKVDFEGLPKNFDRRSNIQFKEKKVTTSADGKAEEGMTINSYTFKSEDNIAVGSCVFDVVRGELESAPYPKTDKPPVHLLLLYFPELRLTVTGYGGEPVFDDLKTTFAPITP